MTDDESNDNQLPSHETLPVPDPHGQAAILLVESLIHSLVARSVLSVADAVEIIDVASEVKVDIAAELGDTRVSLERSLSLLNAISASLRPDIPPA